MTGRKRSRLMSFTLKRKRASVKSKPIPDYQHGYEGEGKVKPFGYDDEPSQEGGLAKYGRPKPKLAAYGFRPEPESYSTPVPPVEHSYGFKHPEYGRQPSPEAKDYGFNGRQHDQGGRRTPPRMEEEKGFAHGGRHQPEFGKGHQYGESEERHAYGEYGGRTSHHREEQEEHLRPSYSRGEHEDEAYGRHRYKSKDDDDDGERRHQNCRHHNLRHDDD